MNKAPKKPAAFQTKRFTIPSISCAHCAKTIEQELEKNRAIHQISIDILQKYVSITYDPSLPLQNIIDTLKRIGYPSKKVDETNQSHSRQTLRLPIALGLSLPFMALMIIQYFTAIHIPYWIHILEGLATGIILFVFGREVIRASLRSFRTMSFAMESLIGIGSITAYSAGLLALFGFNIGNFFSISSMILIIHFIGMEIRTKYTRAASRGVEDLLQAEIRTVQLLTKDGETRETSLSSLNIGDVVLVRAGDTIPVDGIIVHGDAFIDESMISGEPLPVRKTIEQEVYGGTINQDGLLHVRTNRLGKDSFISRIATLIEEARLAKIPIQELVDRISAVFVPVVISLGLLSSILWIVFPSIGLTLYASLTAWFSWLSPNPNTIQQGVTAFITTLVIACPCALGLATPTALSVGIGLAANRGILIRHAAAIQEAKNITTCIFDKTGTLTEGTPRITAMYCIEDSSKTLQFVASVVYHSTHPLSQAIVRHTQSLNLSIVPAAAHTIVSGFGIHARIHETDWYVGSSSYMQKLGITIPPDMSANIAKDSTSLTYIAREDRIIAIYAFHDTLRAEAKDLIHALHKQGIETCILSGDNPTVVAAIAKDLGVDQAYGGVSPQGKIDMVKKLQSSGQKIAMIGDGINDGPALQQADISIAMSKGSNIAVEHANVVLVADNIALCGELIRLSKRTMSAVSQNLLWAFCFNVLAIPLAMVGALHPIVAELAMAASSILVVLNSLRLRGFSR